MGFRVGGFAWTLCGFFEGSTSLNPKPQGSVKGLEGFKRGSAMALGFMIQTLTSRLGFRQFGGEIGDVALWVQNQGLLRLRVK